MYINYVAIKHYSTVNMSDKLLDFQQYYIQYIHACVQNLTHVAMWCVMAPNKKGVFEDSIAQKCSYDFMVV